ncbi:MAG: translation elongation factor Ts [Coprobacillus sp.]|nr:translation elongation factor Ts [Coprobacillus sp.]
MAEGNSIELIKLLRERTGAGLMDCKNALAANDNDLDKATDWMRENGLAKAAKKADRIAAEGLAVTKTCPKCGKVVILEVNCETDFVSQSETFHDFVDKLSSNLISLEPTSVEEATEKCADLFSDATVKMGEKISLRRFETIHPEGEEAIATYIHMGGKIAVACVLAHKDEEFGKQIAMHIAANSPSYVSLSDVPDDVREHEREIQLEAAKNDEKLAGKSLEMINRVVEGKVNKTFTEMALECQPFLMDDSKNVGQVLKEHNNAVLKFVRYQVGEGIEKKKDDFVSEVMKEVNK